VTCSSSGTSDEFVRRPGRRKSKAVAVTNSPTPSLHIYQRILPKKIIVDSSSSSAEVPETQSQQSLDQSAVLVEVHRPVDFNSQDWSTLASSQGRSLVATQQSTLSKEPTDCDSTLGSSLPPDSPVRNTFILSSEQDRSPQGLLESHSCYSRSQDSCTAGGLDSNRRGISCVENLDEIQDSQATQYSQQSHGLEAAQHPYIKESDGYCTSLLVVRSDPADESETLPAGQAEPPSPTYALRTSPSTLQIITDERGLSQEQDLRPRSTARSVPENSFYSQIRHVSSSSLSEQTAVRSPGLCGHSEIVQPRAQSEEPTGWEYSISGAIKIYSKADSSEVSELLSVGLESK
jgi:hypothetical protein